MRRTKLRATSSVFGDGRLSGGGVLSLVRSPVSGGRSRRWVGLVGVLGLVWVLGQPFAAFSYGGAGTQARGSVREPVSPPSQLSSGRSASQLPPRRGANLPATTSFPYNVYTVSGGTAVRSMPSDEAYPTAVLPPRTELQVWRHDPNGWLAVRPPPGSFSLIEAKHLQATSDPNVFAVTTDRAKAWVGTEVDDDHTPIWQVRLQRSERVAVISSLIIQEEGGEQTWYQIEPPAGEFRWVHQDDLRPGSVAYRAPSRRSPAVNRPQAPADAPMSGFMPPVGAGRTAAIDGSGGVGGGLSVELPPLELGSAAAGQAWGQGRGPGENGGGAAADPLAGQWRPAQQTTPELGYVDPTAEPQPIEGGWPNEGGWNASLVAHSGMGGDRQAGLVQAQSAPWAGSGGGAPGDAWDAAVNRLRQDPVAAALADHGPVVGSSESPVGPTRGVAANPSSATPAAEASVGGASVGGASVAGSRVLGASGMMGGSAAGGFGSGGASEWDQQLAEVQARLSRELTLPQATWNLLPWLEQCRQLWRTAPTLSQREAAERVGRQIEDMIQRQWTQPAANDLTAQAGWVSGSNTSGDAWAGQRFASANGFVGSGAAGGGLNVSGTGGAASNPNPFVLAPGVVPSTARANPVGNPLGGSAAPGATSFDAVGYLKELIVARGQSREFVLQDETGRSICHLAAQPGVNMQPLLDQKVGVIGIKGIHGRLNLPHVNVERIYPIP